MSTPRPLASAKVITPGTLRAIRDGTFNVTTNTGPTVPGWQPGEREILREDFNLTVNTLNDMMAKLSESIREIRARSDEISLGSDELARRTESQAATLEEIWTKYNDHDEHGVANDMTKNHEFLEFSNTQPRIVSGEGYMGLSFL